MKRLFLAFLLLLPAAAMAQEKAKPPSCGKTVEECQVKSEADAQTIRELTAAVQGARQQRDGMAQQVADAQLQAFVSAQAPKPTAPQK